MTDKKIGYYRRVINPNPVFNFRDGQRTLPFCRKLMKKAEGFTSRFEFSIHVAFMRSLGKRHRMPPLLRRRAIDALLQGLCFHYDPLANRVQYSLTKLAIDCGLATESKSGNLSITRTTRALHFLADLGLITYNTEYDPMIGCNIPTDITFTPALFSALDISDVAVAAARRSCAEWENQKREKKGQIRLGIEELSAMAWSFLRERFRANFFKLKSHGQKRALARRDALRSFKEISTLVKQQITRQYANGDFIGGYDDLKREVDRRVKERMLLSRGNNYSRLITAIT